MFSDVLNRRTNERCKWKNTEGRQQKEQERWYRKQSQQRSCNRKDEQSIEPTRHEISSRFYESFVIIVSLMKNFLQRQRIAHPYRTLLSYHHAAPARSATVRR